MRIAIPDCNSSVSPVLDTAGRLVIVEVGNGEVKSKHEILFAGSGPREKARRIAENADMLVCGAISRMMCSYLVSLGVQVHPWTMGNIEHIIKIVTSGNIPGPEYMMPGCRRNRRGRCDRGPGFNMHTPQNYFNGNGTVTGKKGSG